MSVLNQSGEEQVECPLCMEPLEVDDLNFFPCTCGYQICRFCWHRIRTDENGLCPACRKAYSENPADFIPLSQEQVAKLKAEKRQRDQQRKAKLTESRKHLASVRVVQKNLVFVVGLPMRLADAEVLKRHEYFGKFGKIHKVVINQSTSYAGSQGPSASAYVTYMKSDDALRAIQSVNNITIDGRLIKSSLGTTKYCSHFMKNQPCPKPDCMYLHDFGDPEASFTKEQMHAGKHQEYEKKLHDALLSRAPSQDACPAAGSPSAPPAANGKQQTPPIPTAGGAPAPNKPSSKEASALSSSASSSSSSSSGSGANGGGAGKENWPQLNVDGKEKKEKGKKGKTKSGGDGRREKKESRGDRSKTDTKEAKPPSPLSEPAQTPTPPAEPQPPLPRPAIAPILDDNSSFFSINSFQKLAPGQSQDNGEQETTEAESGQPSAILTDTLPNINTTEDWAAAFGFARHMELVEEMGKPHEEHKGTLETFRNGFGPLEAQENVFCEGVKSYGGGGGSDYYDIMKAHDIMDMLSTKVNGFGYKPEPQLPPAAAAPPQSAAPNGLNGLDQNMSKFFMDFHKNSKEAGAPQSQFANGFNGAHQAGYYAGAGGPVHASAAERIMLLQQKQLEEQLQNLGLKQGYGGNSVYHNGPSAASAPQHYLNGDNGFANLHGQLYGAPNVKQNARTVEDDLGFDPFQETQKAFAELMASEQTHKTHSIGRSSQINGVIHNHNQNGGHMPPPPPGFVQQNTHMNSFGSKILPFLNMSSSQQQINSSSQSNNWPSSFNSQMQQQQQQQQQQQKNLNSTCNDWKVLDPAILSSSRHYPLASMPPIRDHYQTVAPQLPQPQPQNNGSPLRPFDYTNNAFSNFTQQLQPNFNGFSTHLNSPQNWFGAELNAQISSPPGFRNSQATKQQEC